MGKSDDFILPWYKSIISMSGDIALLGFPKNNPHFPLGDCYDLKLNNWQINSDWELKKKYNTIICTRCAYFAKNPKDFVLKCFNNLKKNGALYVDWGLGDHWRFANYKIGWVKNGEHEYAYAKDNFLWSTVWDHSFLKNDQFILFQNRVKKLGYTDVYSSILKEVPKILTLDSIRKYFNVDYYMLPLHKDRPQLYTLLKCQKK